MRADFVQAYINRGDILMKLNRSVFSVQLIDSPNLVELPFLQVWFFLQFVLESSVPFDWKICMLYVLELSTNLDLSHIFW